MIGGFPIRGESAREIGCRQTAVKGTSAEKREPASTACVKGKQVRGQPEPARTAYTDKNTD